MSRRWRFIAALALLSGGARAQFVLGEESFVVGGDSGFARPPVGVVVPSPTFDLVAGYTTPNDLSDSLTVNSVSMTLVLACDAQGISGTNWSCRDSSGAVTLSEAGTGSSPTTTINTPFHALDSAERGVSYSATAKTHAAASSSVGDITTEDFVVEFVLKSTSTANGKVFDKGLAGTDGYAMRQSSGANSYAFELRTASTTTAVSSPGTTAGQFAHAMVFVDRDEATTNGAIFYVNGSAGTGVNVSARSTTLSNATAFNMGGAVSSSMAVGPIESMRIWKCPTGTPQCMAGGATNPTQWAAIARARIATAFGVTPSIAAGTAAPTTITRATSANVDVVDGNVRHLYSYGGTLPRIARRTYSGGTAVVGLMSEPASSNIALQSQTLGTTWTAITVGDNVLADAWAGADLTTTGDDVDGNNSLAEHGLRQSITLTAATHTMSAWAKAGAQSFVVLRDNTIANGAAWFDVATCTSGSCTIGEDCAAAVKTVQAGVIQARAQRWAIDTTGDGIADVNLCRMSIAYTGTVAAHDHDLLCAPSDGVTSYTDADATADCGFWGVRVEAFPTMTSYLATTTASVARNADDVRFDGASHYTGDPSTMDAQVLCPNFDVAASSTFASVGTGTANYARLGIDATADRAVGDGTVTTAQWSIIAGSGDVSDGVLHKLRQTMATNSIEAFYDGASTGTDTLATLPTVASSSLYLGTTGSTAAAPMCLISRVRLWSSVVTPAVAP